MNLQIFFNPYQPIGGSQFAQPFPTTWPRPNCQPRLSPLPVPQSQMVLNAMIANTGTVPSNSWFPDSGASFHVTNASQNIQQSTPFEGPDQIFIGNGQGLCIHSPGSSYFPSHSHPNTSLVLHNLLHVPAITKNLISVSKFCLDTNVYFEFHSDICYVKSHASNEILLQGRVGSDGLYQFPHLQLIKSPTTSQVSCLTLASNNSNFSPRFSTSISSSNTQQNVSENSSCNSQFTWHLRLGHPNPHTMKLVLSQCNVPYSNKENSVFCSAHCVGKAHRLHSPQSKSQYTTPLELIFSDLWGPAPITSSQKFQYYITFVDACTRFTWIYMIKTKSEALHIFKQFKTMVELQFGHSIKVVQTDWGGEFRPFTKFLSDLGIIHRLICPHTHHQMVW